MGRAYEYSEKIKQPSQNGISRAEFGTQNKGKNKAKKLKDFYYKS